MTEGAKSRKTFEDGERVILWEYRGHTLKILSLVRCIALFLGPLLFPMLSVIESAQAQTQGLPQVFLAGSDKKAAASRSATGVSSQPYVFGRGDFAVGKDPSSIATGDFNGDGILDLADKFYRQHRFCFTRKTGRHLCRAKNILHWHGTRRGSCRRFQWGWEPRLGGRQPELRKPVL